MKYLVSVFLWGMVVLTFNIYLFSGELFFIFFFLFFLFLGGYFYFKNPKNSYLWGAIIAMFLYFIMYTYIPNGPIWKESFLDEKSFEKSVELSGESKFKKCFVSSTCDQQKAYFEEIQEIQSAIEKPQGIISVFLLEKRLNDLITALPELKKQSWWKSSSFVFDKKIYAQKVLLAAYQNQKVIPDTTSYNLFYSQSQYEQYLKNYLYLTYEQFDKNTLIFPSQYPVFQGYSYHVFLNRKYLYASFLEDQKTMKQFQETLASIDRKIKTFP